MKYNVKEVITSAKNKLKKAGVVNEQDAVFLLEKVLNRKVGILENYIDENELRHFEELIERRLQHESMDSILGFTEFLDLIIPFNRETLTPRQETEIMVDSIIKENIGRQNLKILDLCSGSGCIGLALSKHLKAKVCLADVSKDALEISKTNAQLNNVNVNFVQSNMFENIKEKFDIIVSNPPYIPTKDLKSLETEVREYDPVIALDGGEDGLDFYRIIASEVAGFLKDKGLIYLEFGICEANDIKKLLEKDFENIEIIKDYSGIDRYIKARKKSLC